MKTASVLLMVLMGVAVSAHAQKGTTTTTTSSDQIPPVQPPPNFDDKDPVTNIPTPEAVAKSVVDESVGTNSADSDAKTRAMANSPGLPPEVQAAANASELPVITVRQDGGDTVEEYRKKGKLYFVRVLSSTGPTKLYVDDPSAVPQSVMSQLSAPSGMAQPVYYKLLDWK